MSEIKEIIIDLAERAMEDIEDWMTIDPDEYFEADREQKAELISGDLDRFFERNGEYIADDYELSLDDFQEFVGDHRELIVNHLVDAV